MTMAMFDTEFDGSPVVQGVNEDTRWRCDLWAGCAPTAPTCTIQEVTGPDAYGADLSGTLMNGSAFVEGDTIYTPFIRSLVAGKVYRVNVRFVSAGNTRERWFRVRARA
jgi:hypothetical protein